VKGGVEIREALREAHRENIRSCRKCFPDGGNAPVADVVKPDARAMLVGQAPGVREVDTRMPFTGPAGKRLDMWLEKAGVSREEVHFAAIARCFPGKAKGGGDKVPSRRMIENCRPHLDRDFELVGPDVVVLVGGLAIKEVLGVGKLSEAVGTIHRRDGIVYVPLPHPSGASTWLNSPDTKARLEESLAMLGEIMSGARGNPGEPQKAKEARNWTVE